MSDNERIPFDPEWMNNEGFIVGPLEKFKAFIGKVALGLNRTLVGEYPYYLDKDIVPLPGTLNHWVKIHNRSPSRTRYLPFSVYVGDNGITVKQAGYYYFETSRDQSIRESNMLDATYHITPHVITVRLGKMHSPNKTPDDGNAVQRWVWEVARSGEGRWMKDSEIILPRFIYEYPREDSVRTELIPFIRQFLSTLIRKGTLKDVLKREDRTVDCLDMTAVLSLTTDTEPNTITMGIHRLVRSHGHSQIIINAACRELYWELASENPASLFAGKMRGYLYDLCDIVTPLIKEVHSLEEVLGEDTE